MNLQKEIISFKDATPLISFIAIFILIVSVIASPIWIDKILIYLRWYEFYIVKVWIFLLLWLLLYRTLAINYPYNFDRIFLRNLTKICGYTILFLIWIFLIDQIKIEVFLTAAGAIMAFWYWYKKYERDKEIQMIERCAERYNKIIKIIRIKDGNNLKESEDSYADLINLWYEEFYLYQKWYISEELWKEWEYWIYDDITIFNIEWSINYKNLIKNPENKILPIDSSWYHNFFLAFNNNFGNWEKKLKVTEFTYFIINILKKQLPWFSNDQWKDILNKFISLQKFNNQQ